jgi:Aluminium activated malate transporter
MWVLILSATFTGLGACGVSVLVFTVSFISSPVLVVALIPTILNVSINLTLAFEHFIATLIGAPLGAYLGYVCVILARCITDYYYYPISTAFALLPALLVASADRLVMSPLGKFIRPEGTFVALYAVASFSLHQPERTAWTLTLVLCIGSAGAFLTSCLLRLCTVGAASAKSALVNSISDLRTSMAAYFEYFALFFTAGPQHALELSKRYRLVEQALQSFLDDFRRARKSKFQRLLDPSAEHISRPILASTQLLSLKHANDEIFSTHLISKLWNPIHSCFEELTSAIDLALRSQDMRYVSVIKECSQELHELLLVTVSGGINELSDSEAPDILRFVFCILTTVRFSTLLVGILETAELQFRNLGNSFVDSWRRIRRAFAQLFSLRLWVRAMNRDTGYIFKMVIIQQLVAQALVGWQIADPGGIPRNAVWGILPLFYVVKPTFGISVKNGLKGVLGTAIGGSLGLVTILLTTSADIAGYMSQLFIVVFFGVLLSSVPAIGFAALDAAVTWAIVALANWKMQISRETKISYAVDRIILTCIGAGSAVIIGLIIFPRFSVIKLRKTSASLIETSLELFNRTISQMRHSKSITCEAVSLTSRKLVAEYLATAGFDASKQLRIFFSVFEDSLDDAKSELFVLNILTCFQRKSQSRIPSEKILEMIPKFTRLAHASIIFASTGCASVVSPFVHSRIYRIFNVLDIVYEQMRLQSKFLSHSFKRRGTKNPFPLNTVISIRLLDISFERIRDEMRQNPHKYVQGGILRVFATLFAAAEFIDTWVEILNEAVETESKIRASFRSISNLKSTR